MRPSLGCYPLVFSSCLGCCCGQIPTCGLWPALDEAAVVERLESEPLVVDHTCKAGESCVVVEGAEIDLVPIWWSPWSGDVTALVEVEATCRQDEGAAAKLAPLKCAGMVAAAYVATEDRFALEYVTEDVLLAAEPSGLTYEEWSARSSSGGDWD